MRSVPMRIDSTEVAPSTMAANAKLSISMRGGNSSGRVALFHAIVAASSESPNAHRPSVCLSRSTNMPHTRLSTMMAMTAPRIGGSMA